MFSGRHTWCFVVLNLLLLAACIVTAFGQETVFYFLNHQVGRLLPDTLWKNLTALGDTLVALAILAPFLLRHPKLSGNVLLTIILASVSVHVLKNYFHFLRPAAVLPLNTFHVIGPLYQKGSFPSGHAATIFALAMIMTQNTSKKWIKLLLIIVAFVVALSRVMVGAHWPLDTNIGFAIGISAAAFGLAIGRHLQNQYLERYFPLALSPTILALFFYATPYDLRLETFTLGILLLFCSVQPFMALANDAQVQWALFRRGPRP